MTTSGTERVTPSTATGQSPRHATGEHTTYAGLVVVGAAAAVMSFTALAGLAALAGLHGAVGPVRLAWLFPIVVDAYAVITTRVWLRAGTSKGTRDWARANALAAIAASMAGNAAYHVDPSSTRAWVVVAVAAVPPLMLAASVHTAVLVSSDRSRTLARAESRSQSRPPVPAVSRPPGQPVPPPGHPAAGPRLELVPDGRGAKVREMRRHWDAERAAGRQPSGAELDRVAGTSDLGRKKRREWLAAEKQLETAEAGR
jgi:hypothetical protein